jgi:hypothetical protein
MDNMAVRAFTIDVFPAELADSIMFNLPDSKTYSPFISPPMLLTRKIAFI